MRAASSYDNAIFLYDIQRAQPRMLPQDKCVFVGFIRRLLALHGGESPAFATRVVRSTLALLLESSYPRLVELGLRPEAKLAKRREISAFASWLRGLEFLDCAFWLSSTYACLMPRPRRNKQALFFTPPSLSTRLISSLRRQGVRFTEARFADPSCGGSAFLAPLAIEIARELSSAGWRSDRIVTHVERYVTGFELDPILCELSRIFLNMALYDHVRQAGRLLEPKIVEGDALVSGLPYVEKYDVVISNPPYRKLTAAEFAQLPETYQHLVQGQPNLYALFIDVSLRLTAPGGQLGLITPAGFFGGRSFGALRALLRREATLTQVDFIEPRTGAFLNVEQETALTVLRKDANQNAYTTVFVTNDGRDFISLGSFPAPSEPTAPWVLPRSKQDLKAVQAFSSPRWRLEDYGYEPKTGFLVPHRMPMPRLKAKGHKLAVCPLIWATQIGKDGLHHFEAGRGSHAEIYVDVSTYGATHVLTTPSVALQRTSSKDQSRRVRCAPISQAFVDEHGGYMGENHVCFLVPIDGEQPAVSVEVLAKILNSAPVDSVFQCLSGTATVSAYELKAMPLPDPIIVRRALIAGAIPDEAVTKGYVAVASATQNKNKKAA